MLNKIFDKLSNIFSSTNYNMGLYAPIWLKHFFFGKGEDMILENSHPLVLKEVKNITGFTSPLTEGLWLGRTGIMRAHDLSGFYWCVGTYKWKAVEELEDSWILECEDYFDFHRSGKEGTWEFRFPIKYKKWIEGLRPLCPFPYTVEKPFKASYSSERERDEELAKEFFIVCFVETDLNKWGKSFFTKWRMIISKEALDMVYVKPISEDEEYEGEYEPSEDYED
ncbi:hypothetical protein H6G33_09680 [Calothrix sp. FACHB-1219]|uniref:hypothetical protein n=1 Tax=unclassified Calothrix TaxID=2619626 RepID=UPI0016820440|nr:MULTISPECIES: hypothetical protein [unclassified Calothrix]MBD2201617.1 hypothetical protein [Calothrix sp. FACHB-168]MBD2217303.1 hypothetical protein [Calothrix sp. FACHB-1219]